MTARIHERTTLAGAGFRPGALSSGARSSLCEWRAGVVVSNVSPHRHVLEHVIFPALKARNDVRRVLFVGGDWYTADCPRHFLGRDFWTIDVDPEKARYGAAERHRVRSITRGHESLEGRAFDAVICTGVLGWGVNTQDDSESAITECFRCLRPGGLFILGWDEVPVGAPPVSVEEIEALRRFDPLILPPFPCARYPTFSDFGLTFDFFQKPVEHSDTSVVGGGSR